MAVSDKQFTLDDSRLLLCQQSLSTVRDQTIQVHLTRRVDVQLFLTFSTHTFLFPPAKSQSINLPSTNPLHSTFSPFFTYVSFLSLVLFFSPFISSFSFSPTPCLRILLFLSLLVFIVLCVCSLSCVCDLESKKRKAERERI